MELFNSDIATIDYFEESCLIRTTWNECRDAEDFMVVIKQVMEYYSLLKPRKTLWNQTNFNLYLSPELQQ